MMANHEELDAVVDAMRFVEDRAIHGRDSVSKHLRPSPSLNHGARPELRAPTGTGSTTTCTCRDSAVRALCGQERQAPV